MGRISQLVEDLCQARTRDEVDQLIEALAQIGEPVVEPLVQYMRSHRTHPTKHRIVMRLLEKIGYPANRSAMGYMVGLAAILNMPGWEIAQRMVKEIGEPATDDIREVLRHYVRDPGGIYEVQGLCILLEEMDCR